MTLPTGQPSVGAVTDRVDYTGEGLDEAQVSATPWEQLQRWVAEAGAAGASSGEAPEGLALSLATIGADGPDVRTVLVRFLDPSGPGFVTDAGSTKSRQLGADRRCAASLGWPTLFRVVRFRGWAEPVAPDLLAGYWAQRPWGSRISAWASQQSQPAGSRVELEAGFDAYAARFPDTGSADDVPVPPSWAGWRVRPWEVELWAGRTSRLHDRIVYSLAGGVELRDAVGAEESLTGLPLLDDPAGWLVSRRQP